MSRYRNEDDVQGIGPDPLGRDLRGCRFPGMHAERCKCLAEPQWNSGPADWYAVEDALGKLREMEKRIEDIERRLVNLEPRPFPKSDPREQDLL